MLFRVRPCPRKVRSRRRKLPTGVVRVCCIIASSLLIIGLLFLCPQWLLVLMIAVLVIIIFTLICQW